MNIRMIALAAAAAAALGAAAPSAIAMEEEVSMVNSAVANALQAQGFDTTHVSQLTLSEITQINQLMTMDGDTNETQRIRLILDRAADRAAE